MDEEHYAFPGGSEYPINNQLPVIINNPSPGTSNAHFHNAYSGNYVDVAAQNNTYMLPGHRNQMGMEERSGGHAVLPFSQSRVHYPSVSPIPVHPHIRDGTQTHRVRAYHPYQPNSSSAWAIRRRTPPQPEVVFNFDHEPPVEDPIVEPSSISVSHVPPNEPWAHLPQTSHFACQTPTSSTPSTNIDAATSFAQSAFPVGTPDHARKQFAMYTVMTSPWKLNNEFEPYADILLRFATKEGAFWRCAFYENGRRCERSMTDRSRQMVEHIRRHIKLEPYVCEGQACPTSVNGCGKRYSSGDPLRKHRDGNLRGESTCELCGKTLLPGNIIRHRNNSCRETGH